MPVFIGKDRTATGAAATGELAAGSQADVVAALRQKKIIPTSIKVKEEKKGFSLFGMRVGKKNLSIFTRQFSTMLNAGLPLLSCLEILSKQTESGALKRVLSEVRGDVEGGLSLADALRRQPKVFDNLYVNMVESGETGGAIDVIPMFAQMFKGVGAELPAMTKLVMAMSDFLKIWAVPLVIILIAGYTAITRWHKTE